MKTVAPLDRVLDLLPPGVRSVALRDTPIPTLAARAKAVAAKMPGLVRGDIGQIAGVEPSIEVLYGPPVGVESLRASIAETYNRTFHLDDGSVEGLPSGLSAENVTVCTGAAEGLSLLLKCFATGKAVGLPHGHWENYENGVQMAGGRSVIVDYFNAAGELDAEGIERAIRESELSVLIANFPCNPTGAVLNDDEAKTLARIAQDTGVVLIADEVYARLRYDGLPPVSLLRFAPGHAVSVSSASKEYLLPGARVGYVVSARAAVTDKVLRKVVRASTASPNVLGQERLQTLIDGDLEDLRAGRPPSLITRVREAMQVRRDALVTVLGKHGFAMVGRAGRPPQGTIFLMAALPAWWRGTDAELVDAALEAGVFSAIPGAAFGLPGAIRLSFGSMSAADIARLDENLTAFRASLGA